MQSLSVYLAIKRSIVVLIDTTDNIVLMVVIRPGVNLGALPDLQLVSVGCISLALDKGRIVQVPNLSLDFLDGVSHAHHSCRRSGHVTKDVQERTIGVDLDHLLIEGCSTTATQTASHFLALEYLTRVLSMADRTWQSMGL